MSSGYIVKWLKSPVSLLSSLDNHGEGAFFIFDGRSDQASYKVSTDTPDNEKEMMSSNPLVDGGNSSIH